VDTFRENSVKDPMVPAKIREAGDSPVPLNLAANPDQNKGELLEIFWRGRWIIIAAVIVAIGVAILYLQSTTPLYSSSSQIYVEQGGPQIKNDAAVSQGPQDAYYLATQCEVIKSSAILNIAVDQLRDRHVKSFEASDSPVGALKGGLSVDLGKLNDIITVSFESPSPDDSAQAANAIVDAYKQYNDAQRKYTATELLKILDKDLKEREADRDQKMNAMLEFRQENSNIDLEDTAGAKTPVATQELEGLTQALTSARLAEANAQATYEMAKDAIADPVKLRQLMAAQAMLSGNSQQAGNGSLSPDETNLLEQYHELQGMLDDLQGRGEMPDHPDYKAVERRLARVEAALSGMGVSTSGGETSHGMTASEQQFANAYVGAAEATWRLAQIKVHALDESFGQSLKAQQDLAIQSGNKAATYALLAAAFEMAKEDCTKTDEKMKDIHVGEEGGDINVHILEVARPSMTPSKPQKPKVLGIALMLGLSLGLGLAFLNGWMDQRFRSAEDVGGSLSLPILGAVPQIGGRETIVSRGQKAHLQPVSDFAEACRAIRTAIYFGMPDSQAKTLLVTSPLPGDGKSTAASNLAIVMAQAGQKTILLDADFRRPNQHRIFEQSAAVGSTNVLAGTATLEEAIKQTGIKGVDLLPCGPTPTHPAELLNSQAFADLLQELSRRYDHVVVDSPPIMPVTDARILGAICDATVFVVRAEKSTRKVSVFARDVLQSVGTNILGVMINGLSRGRGYYDAGYYQYGYGGKSGKRKESSPAEPAASGSAADAIEEPASAIDGDADA